MPEIGFVELTCMPEFQLANSFCGFASNKGGLLWRS
jgi:hypothetical protein